MVEPAGYAITSFVATGAFVIGVGLAPDGLLLAAAAMILSVIDMRRLRAANPWLRVDDPEAVCSTEEIRILLRWSARGLGAAVALSVLAIVLVSYRGDEAAAIGPGLVAGFGALLVNYAIKLEIARGAAKSGGDASPDDDRDDT